MKLGLSQEKYILLVVAFILMLTSIPINVDAANACFPMSFSNEAKELIDYNKIPTTNLKGKKLNQNYLLNQMGVGAAIVVYGCPEDIKGNEQKRGQYNSSMQWRYLGWDIDGNVYYNWNFPRDSDATKSVGKNWVKEPWDKSKGREKKLMQTTFSSLDDAPSWLSKMLDPYDRNKTFLQSYNRIKNTNWTGVTLLDYAIIQQAPSNFGPGIVQLWSQDSDGNWWYQMFDIPALKTIIEPPKLPDLIITKVVNPSDAWVGDTVTFKVTVKNVGKTDAKNFNVGVMRADSYVDPIRNNNLLAGQETTVTFNIKFTSKGLKNILFTADSSAAVKETDESNNTYEAPIMINTKNEPTAPIAIISHFEGDHRTEPQIRIEPLYEPQLSDHMSYSPGKEAITASEWKYTDPSGKIFNRPPHARDLEELGEYEVQLRVTNSAKKVSQWANLKIIVATEPEPEPEIPPIPDLEADIEFIPPRIVTGETSTLWNASQGLSGYEWDMSPNLASTLPNTTDYEFHNVKYDQAGSYIARIKVFDDNGGWKSDIATLTVIDPKPIAIVTGITKIIQGRPLAYPHHLKNSYTPIADRGVTIDHDNNVMRYKKDTESIHTNGWFTEAPNELGSYILEGKVFDSNGRESDWGQLKMEVIPDKPPTVEIIAPAETYRSSGFKLYVGAESPDGDKIVYVKIEERFDQDDDGDFEEEPWTVIYEGEFNAVQSLSYPTVGKRQYRATVREDYGLEAVSNIAVTDILNYAPSVDFDVYGVIEQPGQGEESGPPVTEYNHDALLRSWILAKPYTGGAADKVVWKSTASSVETKNAIMANFHVKYPDSGNGMNGRTKYQLASDIVAKQPWALPSGDTIFKQIFAGDRIYTWNLSKGNVYGDVTNIIERNALTGEVIGGFTIDKEGYSENRNLLFATISPDEKFYFWNIAKTRADHEKLFVEVYDKTGTFLETITISIRAGVDPRAGIRFTHMEVSEDGRYLYLATAQGYDYVDDNWFGYWRNKFHYYKYDLKQKNLIWEVSSDKYDKGTMTDVMIGESPNGDVYITHRYQPQYSSRYNGYLVRIKQNGEAQVIEMAGDSLSPPTLSNDGKKLYIISGRVTDYSAYDEVNISLYTYDVLDSQLRVSNGKNLSYHHDYAGGTSDQDVFPATPPLVFPDGRLYVQSRAYSEINGYFDYNGNSIKTESVGWSAINMGKAFITDSNEVLFPYMDQVFNPDPYEYYIAVSLRKNMVLEPIAKTPKHNFDQGINAHAWISRHTTPILPNGSIYAFAGTIIQPFLSASGTGSIKGINNDTIEVSNDDWGGLLYDPSSKAKNHAIEFNASVNDLANAKTIGAAIQVQDAKNMYAMEWTKDTLTLYKVVNGTKTALKSISRDRTPFLGYTFKLESVNGVLRVFINHTKVIEVSDHTFNLGTAGIMSLGQPNASFSNIKRHNYGDNYVDNSYGAVLVGDPVMYEQTYLDIEKDPIGKTEWSYSHNPNFFENPLGLSIYHGLKQSTTVNTFDKPGVYEISFRAQDDVTPASYEKWSEIVTKLLYVHRRPVAVPDVRFTGKVYPEGEALDYETYDKSYDPDVPTILGDKLYRTRWSDETNWTIGKRPYYNRPGFDLIIQEQVRDIHGAWSYWAETSVFKPVLPVVNQTKPVMTITVPAGVSPQAATTYIDLPAIRWTYFDQEGDPQEFYRLVLTYVDNKETVFYGEYAGDDLEYQVPDGWIEKGRVVQVQGQVYSNGVWSDLSNSRYFILNTPPVTTLTSMNGGQNSPIYTNNNKPVLTVATADKENHPITRVDYEVFYNDDTLVVDTNNSIAVKSYTVPSAMKDGLHYWQARAFDSYTWGEYSERGFFFVDTVKPLDVDEQLEIEPTAVTVRFNAFSDPAPSSGHAARVFYLQQVNDNGSLTNIDLNGDGRAEYSIPLGLNTITYRVTGLVAGQRYRLTVIDTDRAGNEGRYAYIYFYTNRPPTADLDWSPKPVYEGDTVQFATLANDPDGDDLSVVYEVRSPSGLSKTYNYQLTKPYASSVAPTIRMAEAGGWQVSLKVSDGIAAPVRIARTIQVLPLTVAGEVKHTEHWDANRIAFNRKISGNDHEPRAYSVFWAGERFLLEGTVTDTGTATVPERVSAAFGKRSVELSPTSSTLWKGDLWEEEFISLKDGKYSFIFTAYYSNGTVKTAEASIEIMGNSLQLAGIHRVQ